jgi:hypothetical protein
VLEVFADGAEVFVAADAGPLDVVTFAAVTALAPALVLWAAESLVGLAGARLRRLVHLFALGALATLLFLRIGKQVTDLGAKHLSVVAVLVAGIVVLVTAHWSAFRTWLRLLALATPVFVAVFLFSSPVDTVVFGDTSRNAIPVADVVPERPAPVVMILLDELPTASLLDSEGQIDSGLWPNFAGLAADATWYRNHTTVAAATKDAIPAILTGRWPRDREALPTAGAHPENLFTLLGGSYPLEVHEAESTLCPDRLCGRSTAGLHTDVLGTLLDDAREVLGRSVSPKRERTALDLDVAGTPVADVERRDQFLRFVDRLRAADGPRLDLVHSLLPHGGWTFLPSGQRYEAPHPPAGNVYFQWRDDFSGAAGRQRHLLQLRYTDALLGRALDRLRDLGVYDDSLVVVTADHGVSFRSDEPLRNATEANYTDIMWTPLFIKAPGQRSAVLDEQAVRSIDVLPTVADHLGVDVPWPVDGRSVRAAAGPTGKGVRIFRGPVESKRSEYLTFDGVVGYRRLLGEAVGADIGSGPLELYRFGRLGHLVGMRTDQYELGPPNLAGRFERGPFRPVDPDDPTLPVYVTGIVQASSPVTVAVAVNGVIGAWCDAAYPRAGSDHPFWAVVPPALLNRGANRVEVFEVRGAPAKASLLPVAMDT